MVIKIATLNLCLGLKNKKLQVKNLVTTTEIDILLLQETEIEPDYDTNTLSFAGYNIEAEINTTKTRVGAYIKNEINYTRKINLEGTNSHLLILDLEGQSGPTRIINIYRSFNPSDGRSAKEMFNYQLDLIKLAYTNSAIIVGDFNLDFAKRHDPNYPRRALFEDFETKLGHFNLVQIINFPTWSRLIGNNLKSSTLDHIYLKDPTLINEVTSMQPIFGDHLMITFNLPLVKPKIEATFKRDWRKYNSINLNLILSHEKWEISEDNVQNCWNDFENILIKIIDKLAPMTEFNIFQIISSLTAG